MSFHFNQIVIRRLTTITRCPVLPSASRPPLSQAQQARSRRPRTSRSNRNQLKRLVLLQREMARSLSQMSLTCPPSAWLRRWPSSTALPILQARLQRGHEGTPASAGPTPVFRLNPSPREKWSRYRCFSSCYVFGRKLWPSKIKCIAINKT